MQTSIIGYPRVGSLRELKFATEKYFKKEITVNELYGTAKGIRRQQWQLLYASGLDFIPSNDFSFYDTTLDTAVLFNIIPRNPPAVAGGIIKHKKRKAQRAFLFFEFN